MIVFVIICTKLFATQEAIKLFVTWVKIFAHICQYKQFSQLNSIMVIKSEMVHPWVKLLMSVQLRMICKGCKVSKYKQTFVQKLILLCISVLYLQVKLLNYNLYSTDLSFSYKISSFMKWYWSGIRLTIIQLWITI